MELHTFRICSGQKKKKDSEHLVEQVKGGTAADSLTEGERRERNGEGFLVCTAHLVHVGQLPQLPHHILPARFPALVLGDVLLQRGIVLASLDAGACVIQES